MKAIALIDGEHLPAGYRDALARLGREHDVCSALFVGGQEKVPQEVFADPRAHYGLDVVEAEADPAGALADLADATEAEIVVDLSGEPVLELEARLELAAVALDRGLEYRAPGLVLTPPPRERIDAGAPVLSVIGTGKRHGKTAVGGHLARLLDERGVDPVLVAMGRGGPAEPTLVRAEDRPGRESLLAIARAGGHGASDYLEGAVLAGVTAVGCRRCGEGLAGEVFDSNVAAGVRLAASLDPGAIVLEGSGASLPPVEADRTVCVVGARSARADALSGLGLLRVMRADLILLMGAEQLPPDELAELRVALARWCGDATVLAASLEPEPAAEVPGGARVAVFTTAAPGVEERIRSRLAERGIDAVAFSTNLANRAALARDLEAVTQAGCNLFLTELKAAAIDMVAEHADREGIELVFLRNRPVAHERDADLDSELMALFDAACAAPAGRTAHTSAS